MSYESCQEIFKLTPHPSQGRAGYFNEHLHFYVGNESIKFGVFNAGKNEIKPDPEIEYCTVVAELTLRETVSLQFGNALPSKPILKNYKIHIATQVLKEYTKPSSTPQVTWPEYDPDFSHICHSLSSKLIGKDNPKPFRRTGDFMCAKPVLIYKQGVPSGSTALVLSIDYIERPDTDPLNFKDYFFIVCYGPYNHIILCAIEKSSDDFTDYVTHIENFDISNHILAVGIDDLGTPSDYMETYVHFNHTLYSVAPNGVKTELIKVVRVIQ